MKIYGSAILDRASSSFTVDFDGEEEISKNELHLLAYTELTWKGMDVPEEECNWVVVETTNKIGLKGAEIETSMVFETIKEFQRHLIKQIRASEETPKMTLVDNMEIILLNGATEMMDIYSIKDSLKVKAIGENHTMVAEVPAITEESIKKLEEYRGYESGYCADWTEDEFKVYFFGAGMSTTLSQVKN